MRHHIDYARLGRAVSYYEKHGIKYIEVPWYVHDHCDAATRPPQGVINNVVTRTPHVECGVVGNLVASAEQSFIQLMIANDLNQGWYQTITPCFRFLDDQGPLNFDTFMKLEIFKVRHFHAWDDSFKEITDLADVVLQFFMLEGIDNFPCRPDYGHPETQFSFDLDSRNNVELGSYGYRTVTIGDNEYSWFYGTGLAEPRFSQALEIQKNEKQ